MCKTRRIALLFVTLLCLSFVFLTRSALGAAAPVPPAQRATRPAKDAGKESAAPAAKDDAAVVVARIGDYTILRKELEERLVRELRPHEEEFARPPKPVTVEGVLRTMLGEKAMSMEGRNLGYLKDEILSTRIKEMEDGRLAMMVQQSCFPTPPAVDPNQVAALLKQHPQLNREQVTVQLQRQAAIKILDQFYAKLVEKFHLQKVKDNFAPAAQAHERLLRHPAKPREATEYWILNRQVQEELSEQEKNLVLATYDGGKYTLKDWFLLICNIAPPRRPEDLSTPVGVENLLDRALRLPILVAEAKARGYDKDPKLRSEIRQYEDQNLLYKVQEEKTKGMKQPTPEEIKAYFEKDKDRFAQPATVKISQIWCENLEAAKKVKAVLDGGNDFEVAKKVHSLQKEEPPHPVSAVGEGVFWADLWKAEPNQIVGPLRGFYGSGVKWRMVKVLEKTPAKPQAYSEQLANNLKWTLLADQRQQILDEYQDQLLKKYPYEIFGDRIKEIDPLEIATNTQDK
jgi:hypothetical protein